MAKRFIYIIILIAIIGLGSIYYFVFKPASQYNSTSLLCAIPPDSPLLINIEDPVSFFEKIKQNEMVQSLRSIQQLNTYFSKAEQFFNFVETDLQLLHAIKGKQMILSLNFSGKDDISLLTVIKLGHPLDKDVLYDLINYSENLANTTVNTRKYNKIDILEISNEETSYFLAADQGIVVFSDKSFNVEEALLQINTDLTTEHPEIEPLLKTIGYQADIQLFINHSQIDRLLTNNLSKPMKNHSALLKIFTGWTELDVNFIRNKIMLSGFSNGSSEENFYDKVFLQQQPVNSKIEKVIPKESAYFLNFSLSNIDVFFSDYESFLEKRNLFLQRKDQLKKIENETGINIQEMFKKMIDRDIAAAGITTDQNQPTSGKIWIIETKSGHNAMNQIIQLQNSYLKSVNQNPAGWSNDFEIDAQTSFTIYKFPYPKIPQVLFGKVFSEIDANWVSIYDNYLVFGDSFQTVAKAIRSNILGETLAGSLDYAKIKSDLNSKSTINFYCNTAQALPIASIFFNSELSSDIASNPELLKFKTFTWQISSTSNMLYNNACLTYSSEVKSKPQTIWQSHIKSNFDFKPKFVVNHTDQQNKEVVLHDNDLNFYLINNVGRIVWQIKLDAPILGEVQQIDYFKNGKLQYLFNTENKLYIVDREGNMIKNFPVNFRAKATNPVAVFDYENNRDYRFFVACDDKIIYAYLPDGNLLKGWEPFKTDHIVTQPIQHFRVTGKDYIVASDQMKDYILHRTGKIRIETNDIYTHSKNNTLYFEEQTSTHEARIVSTENNGTIHRTYFDGKHETLQPVELSGEHYFVAENVNSDD